MSAQRQAAIEDVLEAWGVESAPMREHMAISIIMRLAEIEVAATERVLAWCDQQDIYSKGESPTTAAVRAALRGAQT